MKNKLSFNNILSELEITEQPQAIKKSIQLLGDALKLDYKTITRIIGTDLGKVEGSLKRGVTNFVKKSDEVTLKNLGNQLPQNVKQLSKELALKRLLEASNGGKKKLTTQEITNIIEKTKNDTKLAFKDAQINFKGNATTVAGGAKGTGGAVKDGRSWLTRWFSKTKKGKNITTQIPQERTLLTLVFNTIDTTKKILKWGAGLTILALVGFGLLGTSWYKKVTGGKDINPDNLPPLPKSLEDWKTCIVDALYGKSNILVGMVGEIAYIKYEVSTYDGKETGGWVKFYSDYRVKTKSGITGKWDCRTNLQEQEETSAVVDRRALVKNVNDLIDHLDGWVGLSNLQSIYNILNGLKDKSVQTLDGKTRNALEYATYLYTQNEGGDTLIGDVQSVGIESLDPDAIGFKDMILDLLGSGSSSNGGGSISDKNAGSEGSEGSIINVTWDGGSTSSTGGKIKYHPNNEFPLDYGSYGEKIKQLQNCLNPTGNLKVDGYYGPNTLKTILDSHYHSGTSFENDKLITQSIYDKIIENCGDKVNNERSTENTITQTSQDNLQNIEAEPIELPVIDVVSAQNLHGKDYLVNQMNKTVDGELISRIIKDKVKYSGGRYKLKMDDELTEKQLKLINAVMAGKGYKLLKKKEQIDKSRYVWEPIDRESRKNAYKQRNKN